MRKAEKLAGLPPYIFAQLDEKVYQMREAGKTDIVDFGKADPDHPTPAEVVKRLQETAADPENHHYPAFRGSLFFREKIAAWYKERFGVEVDPEKEVLALIGSKEGLFHISLAYISQGDVGLVPDPAFPAYNDGVFFAGGQVYRMPLTKENRFLPDLGAIPAEIRKRAKLLFLNYPNNPTGALASADFIEHTIRFARENQVIVCYDNAYCEITYEGVRARSFLEYEGAKQVGVEFFTFSKAFNMAGWRLGAAVGNAEAIQSLLVVQSHINSGVFAPIQFAGATALTDVWHSRFGDEMRREYQRRRDYAIGKFQQINWDVHKPQGAVYLWVPVPGGMTSLEFANRLLDEYSVVVAPGTAFGETGEGYVRVSLTTAYENVVKGIDRLCEAIWKWA
ncbi:aminotransferase class I/II-fold pyridoxal phosphate-dependent enzyme [Effusibacillus pohliae]|uniref:aminotransferase class I/II-fold pyridoxal phosphate-dependent enzyme n=1 Tax=Effusibacillus pohliae TaxID=232270 RepID=UPI000372200B|nr:aminotransferase class I/II-fold pyridoxal phosphate-dependent enzyme [Effusibacillus pohliae]